MMSYPVRHGDAYQQTEWRRSLDDALQRLVESNQRREQEQEGAAYMAAMLRLMSEAEGAGLVNPGDMDVMDVVEEEEEGPGPYQGPADQDYDDTSRSIRPGNSQAASWALLERLDPQLASALLERSRQNQLDQRDPRLSTSRGTDSDLLRYLVARILGSMASPKSRSRRDVAGPRAISPTHTRSRRSLDDTSPPLPSSDPPLLRVKRLRLEEGEVTAQEADGHSRRRRAVVTFNPRVLAQQLLQVLQE
ncbi:hypothetical protein N1851_034469 [Merluccius polli]|uniref:Uncharacterized protein n=1 Tax=Merluccius polli TaxID=89951 RepID=A0AA47LZK3_MERPO|nr:hypothetical protein N1851_034469 [Merluccius polli]